MIRANCAFARGSLSSERVGGDTLRPCLTCASSLSRPYKDQPLYGVDPVDLPAHLPDGLLPYLAPKG